MNVDALLEVLGALGCEVRLIDGTLDIRAADPPPEALLALVRTHREVLIDHLRPPALWNDRDWHVHYNERVAILMHDAGFSRTHAEIEALQDYFHRFAGRRAARASPLAQPAP